MPDRREVGRLTGLTFTYPGGVKRRNGHVRVGIYDGLLSIGVGTETVQLDASQREEFSQLFVRASHEADRHESEPTS
jgi:hypothetical protein